MNKTTLITGGTGYIGSWVAKDLLEKGYTVRLTVRDKNNQGKYQYLQDIANNSPGKIEVWQADLLSEGAYDEAAKGCGSIIHMASPFTLKIKDAQKQLVDPALKGTTNVLRAATNSGTVKKVVLTSSVAAVHGDSIDMQELGIDEFTEEHFNYSSSLKHQPYSYSKVLAEKEAWKIHDAQSSWKLIVINPSFVMGPFLTVTSSSESINFMRDMLKGKFAMGAPYLVFGYVDVRDVSRAHILALENDKASGRHILAERTASVYEFAMLIKKKYGKKYKLPRMQSPKLMLYMLGWAFGLTLKFIKRNVGYPVKLNNSKSIDDLGLSYTPLEQTIEDMVECLTNKKIV